MGVDHLVQQNGVEVHLGEGHISCRCHHLRVGHLVELLFLGVAEGHDIVGDLAEEDQHDGVGEDQEYEGVEREDDDYFFPKG